LQIGILGFSQKETGAKSVAMATTQKVSFCLSRDAHPRCQARRTPLQYF